MNTKEIANRLVQLCREGEFDKAQNELFSKDAVKHRTSFNTNF
jgi:hypothetical protein